MKSDWQLNKLMAAVLSPYYLVLPDNCSQGRGKVVWQLLTDGQLTERILPPSLFSVQLFAGLGYNVLSPRRAGERIVQLRKKLSAGERQGV